MSKKQLTVSEIKKQKTDLEADFLKKLQTFEASSDIQINHVIVEIDNYSYDEEEGYRKTKKKPRPLKGVLSVVIKVEIENDPRSVDIIN